MAYLIDFEDKSASKIASFLLDSVFWEAAMFDDQRIIADGNIIEGIEAKE